MSNATELSDTIAGLVEVQGPSIVRVEARHRLPSSGIIWSADGIIVTAQHTIEREEGIEIGLFDGRTVPARLLGKDQTTDIAVLKVDATDLPPAPFGDLEGVKVGHLAVALARPGRSTRATFGIVNALGDSEGFRTPSGGRIERYVESDLSLRGGFSGGALVDLGGRVLGLNTSGLLRSVSLAVPTATIRRVVEKLQAHGKLQRAYLGLGTYPVRLPVKVAEEVGQESALLVVSVQAEGPSDKAGIVLGDVILALDGKPLSELGDLLELLTEDRINKVATAKVYRAGAVTQVGLVPSARGE